MIRETLQHLAQQHSYVHVKAYIGTTLRDATVSYDHDLVCFDEEGDKHRFSLEVPVGWVREISFGWGGITIRVEEET